jgi:hypothetical protein
MYKIILHLKNYYLKMNKAHGAQKGNTNGLKHGFARTVEYKTWTDIKQRCLCKTNKYYSRYGGRGIKMHNPWINSFVLFFDCVGERPSVNHSLDRIDNNGNYEPGNIRWTDYKTQGNNKRNNLNYTYNGETNSIAVWAEKYNMKYMKLYKRLITRKWPFEKSITN